MTAWTPADLAQMRPWSRDDLLTFSETARRLGVRDSAAKRLLADLEQRHVIPARRVNGSPRYLWGEVLDGIREEPPAMNVALRPSGKKGRY